VFYLLVVVRLRAYAVGMKNKIQERMRITLELGATRPPTVVLTSEAAQLIEQRCMPASGSTDRMRQVAVLALALCRDAIDECREVRVCDCGMPH
jgi:hypothetical protein